MFFKFLTILELQILLFQLKILNFLSLVAYINKYFLFQLVFYLIVKGQYLQNIH